MEMELPQRRGRQMRPGTPPEAAVGPWALEALGIQGSHKGRSPGGDDKFQSSKKQSFNLPQAKHCLIHANEVLRSFGCLCVCLIFYIY